MITGKDMIEWGLSGKAIKVALGVFVPQIQYSSAQDVEKTCKAIVNDPEKFSADKLYGELANMIISQRPPKDSMIQLMENPCPTTIFGESLIATNAISQIHDSSKLLMFIPH